MQFGRTGNMHMFESSMSGLTRPPMRTASLTHRRPTILDAYHGPSHMALCYDFLAVVLLALLEYSFAISQWLHNLRPSV